MGRPPKDDGNVGNTNNNQDNNTGSSELSEFEQLRKRNEELEAKLKLIEDNQSDSMTGRYVIVATVPDMRVKLDFPYPPFMRDNNGGQKGWFCRECSVFLSAFSNGRDYGIDPNTPGGKYAEILHEYPPDPKTGIQETIGYAHLVNMAERYKKLGIVLWDKSVESKHQAQIRGLRNYLSYIGDLTEKLNNRHSSLLTVNMGNAGLIPTPDRYGKVYPKIDPHLKRKSMVESSIKKLNAVIGAA